MKAILALLLGLLSQSWADSDSVKLEFESLDSDEVSTGIGSDEAVSYGGVIIQVRQSADAAPTIALGTDIDDYDDVYCLNFLGLFEASDYDTSTSTSAAYTAIDGTNIDLATANCTTTQEAATVFSIRCTNVGEATLTLTFTFIQDTAGDYGLEYIINLQDYELSGDTAKLVLVQSLNECGDTVDLVEDEEDASTDDDTSTTETPEPTETDEPDETESAETEEPTTTSTTTTNLRRLLQEDTTTTTDFDETEETEIDETEVSGSEEEEEEEEEDASTDEEDDASTDASTDDDTSTDESTDAESLEEEDGISEDDSGEFDRAFAKFVVHGQALDVCDGGQTEINSTLVYQPDDDELHIVFDSFDCTLVLDPFYGLDDSKYQQIYGATERPITTEDNAQSFNVIIAMVIGLFAYLW